MATLKQLSHITPQRNRKKLESRKAAQLYSPPCVTPPQQNIFRDRLIEAFIELSDEIGKHGASKNTGGR